MKAAEFPIVGEAHRAAQGHLGFFNKMMAAKSASSVTSQKAEVRQDSKQNAAKPPSKNK